MVPAAAQRTAPAGQWSPPAGERARDTVVCGVSARELGVDVLTSPSRVSATPGDTARTRRPPVSPRTERESMACVGAGQGWERERLRAGASFPGFPLWSVVSLRGVNNVLVLEQIL